jgi:hypothetical protein
LLIWDQDGPEREEGRPVEAGTNRSAQDWFRLMIDMGLAPGLRVLGFVGAGRRYRMEIDGHLAEILILESQPLTTDRIRFTLQLRVLGRDEWTEQLRVRPYSAAKPASLPGWTAPIGALISVGGYPVGELWWELEVGKPFDALAREVLTILRSFGIPAISHQIRAAG